MVRNPCYAPKDRRSNSRRYQPTVCGETFKTWTSSSMATASCKVCTLGSVAFHKRIYTMRKGHLTIKKGGLHAACRLFGSLKHQGIDCDFPLAQLQPQSSQVLPDPMLLFQNQGCQFLNFGQKLLMVREVFQFFPCSRSLDERRPQVLILVSSSGGGLQHRGPKSMGPMIKPGAQAGCLVSRSGRSGRGVPYAEGYLENCLTIFDPGNYILDLSL